MKITEQKTETVTRDVVTDIRCNLCGESCLDTHETHNNLGVEVNIHGCYGSAFPADMTSWKFHLCELCVTFLVSRFKLFPEIEDNMGMIDHDAYKAFLMKGETGEYADWVKVRYAAAMSRLSLFSSSEAAQQASKAAKSAAEELESQRKTHREEAWAMHAVLDKIAAPRGPTDGAADAYPVSRVAALSGSVDDRLVELLRTLHRCGQDRFDGKGVEGMTEAVALDKAHCYLTERGKL